MSVLESRDILKILPHRPPFLLVDRILEINAGESAVGIKNVTMNEPFFEGHFPENPIMPGVLIVEALAQVGAVAILSMPKNKDKLALFTGIDKLKFRRQVVPGDVLRLEARLTAFRRGIGKAEATAFVGEKVAASGELSFALVDK